MYAASHIHSFAIHDTFNRRVLGPWEWLEQSMMKIQALSWDGSVRPLQESTHLPIPYSYNTVLLTEDSQSGGQI